MTTEEIYAALGEKVGQNWAEYQERMTQLSPDTLFMKADEIAAARLCFNELTENQAAYPEHFLEHLLQFDNPLEIVRDQWMDEQCIDYSIDFEHALWSIRDHGPEPEIEPESSPQMGGMTQI